LKNGIKIRIPIDDPTGVWLTLKDKDGDTVSILHASTMDEGLPIMKKQKKLWKRDGVPTEIVQIVVQVQEDPKNWEGLRA
jgi:hypothetical protein